MFRTFLTLTILSMALLATIQTHAAVVIKNHTGISVAEQMRAENGDMTEQEIRDTLANDIRIIDEELDKCKKSKKIWTAATVVGSVGVVGTGIGAIVQHNQIKGKKAELKEAQEELKEAKKELKETR